jgi:two-component system response regulator
MRELSILLVEDNEDDRFLTTRAIKKLPFPVKIEIARNGDEALRRIVAATENPATDLPKVVLLDLQMPKIGGINLLVKIRELFDSSALAVIILSSSDNPSDIAQCTELGICAYLPKPIDLSLLQEQLLALARETTPP